jgi:hypothetical protein
VPALDEVERLAEAAADTGIGAKKPQQRWDAAVGAGAASR